MAGLSKSERGKALLEAMVICAALETEDQAGALYFAGMTNKNRSVSFSRTDAKGARWFTVLDARRVIWDPDVVRDEARAALRP